MAETNQEEELWSTPAEIDDDGSLTSQKKPESRCARDAARSCKASVAWVWWTTKKGERVGNRYCERHTRKFEVDDPSATVDWDLGPTPLEAAEMTLVEALEEWNRGNLDRARYLVKEVLTDIRFADPVAHRAFFSTQARGNRNHRMTE